MSKRFLDTNFLSQAWIRKLSPEQKCFLIYLMLECDNAGIIDLDMEAAEFWIGKKLGNITQFLPNGYLIFLEKSGKFFMPKFIEWQYPNFPYSKVHQQAQAKEILIKHGLFDTENQQFILPKSYPKLTQDLPNGYPHGNGNVNVNDNGNVNIKSKEENFLLKFNSLKNSKFKGTEKFKRQFNARIKEGFTSEDILLATEACLKDSYHQEHPQYLTPEFITRSDKLEKYLNYARIQNDRAEQKQYESEFNPATGSGLEA